MLAFVLAPIAIGIGRWVARTWSDALDGCAREIG